MLLGRTIKCKKCKRRVFKQDVYRTWHNVDCFHSIGNIAWVRNWWVCTTCLPVTGNRFHDIDG